MAQIEIEMFKLRDGVTPDAYLQLNDVHQEWSYLHRRGLMRRTVARFDDLWLVETWWNAQSVPDLDVEEPEVKSWLAAMDAESYRRREFTTIE